MWKPYSDSTEVTLCRNRSNLVLNGFIVMFFSTVNTFNVIMEHCGPGLDKPSRNNGLKQDKFINSLYSLVYHTLKIPNIKVTHTKRMGTVF